MFYGVTIKKKLSSELYLSGSGCHKESVSGLLRNEIPRPIRDKSSWNNRSFN